VVRFEGEPDVVAGAGDIVIILHGDPHTVSNGAPSRLLDAASSLGKFLSGDLTTARFGGGETTQFVCGFFGCERHADRLFLAGLPCMIKINIRGDAAGDWLERSSATRSGDVLQGGCETPPRRRQQTPNRSGCVPA
jgi:Cupin